MKLCATDNIPERRRYPYGSYNPKRLKLHTYKSAWPMQ